MSPVWRSVHSVHEGYMRRALAVAADSPGGVDVPVGAVVFGPDGEELGYGATNGNSPAIQLLTPDPRCPSGGRRPAGVLGWTG
jgi:hypothetical protein